MPEIEQIIRLNCKPYRVEPSCRDKFANCHCWCRFQTDRNAQRTVSCFPQHWTDTLNLTSNCSQICTSLLDYCADIIPRGSQMSLGNDPGLRDDLTPDY